MMMYVTKINNLLFNSLKTEFQKKVFSSSPDDPESFPLLADLIKRRKRVQEKLKSLRNLVDDSEQLEAIENLEDLLKTFEQNEQKILEDLIASKKGDKN